MKLHVLTLFELFVVSLCTTVSYPPAVQRYRTVVKELDNKIECNLQCVEDTVASAQEDSFTTRTEITDRPVINLRQPTQSDSAECSAVIDSAKFDCFPGRNVTFEDCESRGCCWEDSPGGKDFYERTPPSCFFPPSYSGYELSSTTDELMGPSATLSRSTESGYPDDVVELKMDFLYETDTRIRIRIYDPNNDRWEVPMPILEDVDTPSTNPQYTVDLQQTKGSFRIIRTSTGQPIFDTTGAAPLIFADQFIQISTLLSTNYIYGLGQHLEGLLLDTNWHRRILWNYDQGVTYDTNLYGSHPFYLGFEPDHKAHGVFFHNSNTMEVMLQPLPALTFRTLGGILDFYIFVGPTPQDVVRQYTDLIGKPFLPPYWSLGYHQCRYNYFSVERTREVWQQTRDAGIPYDVQWNDIDSLELFRIFTYNKTNFETLPEFIEELHSVDMKYIPIVDPGLPADTYPGEYPPVDAARNESVLILDENGEIYVGRAWPGATAWPDFTNADTTTFWTKQFSDYHEIIPYDGAWLDMNEPADFAMTTDMCNPDNKYNQPPYTPEVEGGFLQYRTICMSAQQAASIHYNAHNLYSITNCQATNTALRAVRGKRPFIISRSSYPGLGHYAGHWQGDSESTYFMLQSSIPDILNFQLYGIPMMGADICGFNHNTTIPLCKMWYLVGAMYPFSRNHNNEFCIPQDPVSLGDEVVTVARDSLTVRYRLLPFLYSLFFNAHLTGDPVARPLFYEFPDDENTYFVSQQLMWGGALLIIPALYEDTYSVNAYVPEGLWYNWYSGELEYNTTGQYYDMNIPDDLPNIFSRGGYIVPVQSPGVTTALSRQNAFGLEVALNGDGTADGYLYFDDGDSLSTVSDNEFNYLEFTSTISGISIVSTVGYQSEMRMDYIRVLGLPLSDVGNVIVNGENAQFTFQNQVLEITGFNQTLLESFDVFWI